MTEWPAERQMILVKCGERDAATKSKDWPKSSLIEHPALTNPLDLRR
jgi:hypothetical protein